MEQTTMQGLTPTISVMVPVDVDLTEALHVYPSIKQIGVALVRPEIFDVSEHQVDLYLTQEETLKLMPGSAEVQVNWTYSSGQRGAIYPVKIRVLENHLLEVLE